MKFLEQWFEEARRVFSSPSDFFESVESSGGFGKPLKFALLSITVQSILYSVSLFVISQISMIGLLLELTALSMAILTVQSIVSILIGLFVWAGIVHFFVYLFGGESYQKTFEVVSYSTAVQALVGWIPLVNLISIIYVWYIQTRGIENFHELSYSRALASVVTPALTVLLITILNLGFLILAINALGGT